MGKRKLTGLSLQALSTVKISHASVQLPCSFSMVAERGWARRMGQRWQCLSSVWFFVALVGRTAPSYAERPRAREAAMMTMKEEQSLTLTIANDGGRAA